MSDLRLEQRGGDVLLFIKAVPGASRNQVAGLVGDRLKIRIAAAAEGGKANKAICKLIASTLGAKTRDVSIETGQTNPEKIVCIIDASVDEVRGMLI